MVEHMLHYTMESEWWDDDPQHPTVPTRMMCQGRAGVVRDGSHHLDPPSTYRHNTSRHDMLRPHVVEPHGTYHVTSVAWQVSC